MCLSIHIEAVQFDRSRMRYTGRWRTSPNLSVCDQLSIRSSEDRRNFRIRKLGGLLFRPVICAEMSLHVFGIVIGVKSLLKTARGEFGKLLRVAYGTQANSQFFHSIAGV